MGQRQNGDYIAGTRRSQQIERRPDGTERVVSDSGDEPLVARRMPGKLRIPRGTLRSSVEDDFQRARTGGANVYDGERGRQDLATEKSRLRTFPIGGEDFADKAQKTYDERPGRGGRRGDINLPDERKGKVVGDLDIADAKGPDGKSFRVSRPILGGEPDDPRFDEHNRRLEAAQRGPTHQTGSILGRLRGGDASGAAGDAMRTAGSAMGFGRFRRDVSLPADGTEEAQAEKKKKAAAIRNGLGILKGLARKGAQ